jgi:hypothetical protein
VTQRLCKYDKRPCFVGVAPNDRHWRCDTLSCFYGPDALSQRLEDLRARAQQEKTKP